MRSKSKVCLFCAVVLLSVALLRRTEVLHVVGVSMEPTLLDNSAHFSVCTDKAERGDVISLYSAVVGEYIVKRVVAVEGDTVQYSRHYVSVNDEVLFGEPDEETRVTLVRPNCVFLVGDNHDLSVDSRFFGQVQLPTQWYKVMF